MFFILCFFIRCFALLILFFSILSIFLCTCCINNLCVTGSVGISCVCKSCITSWIAFDSAWVPLYCAICSCVLGCLWLLSFWCVQLGSGTAVCPRWLSDLDCIGMRSPGLYPNAIPALVSASILCIPFTPWRGPPRVTFAAPVAAVSPAATDLLFACLALIRALAASILALCVSLSHALRAQ